MRAKVIGILVFLVLIVAIVVTGVGAVTQAVSVATDETGQLKGLDRLSPNTRQPRTKLTLKMKTVYTVPSPLCVPFTEPGQFICPCRRPRQPGTPG